MDASAEDQRIICFVCREGQFIKVPYSCQIVILRLSWIFYAFYRLLIMFDFTSVFKACKEIQFFYHLSALTDSHHLPVITS